MGSEVFVLPCTDQYENEKKKKNSCLTSESKQPEHLKLGLP